MQTIAQRVLSVRNALGLSQAQFAKQMMYGRHYISLVERGKSANPSNRFMEQLKHLEKEAMTAHKSAEKSSRDAAYSHPQSRGIDASSTSTLQEEAPPFLPAPPHVLGPPRIRAVPDSNTGDEPDEELSEAINLLTWLYDTRPPTFQLILRLLKRFSKP